MKVYVSKSNAADIDLINKVRNFFTDAGHTVLQHEGGNYDPSKIMQADICVMVGPRMHDAYPAEGHIIVGKGQFEEAQKLTSTFILVNGTKDEPKRRFAHLINATVIDETSYQKYGILHLSDHRLTINQVAASNIDSSSSISNNDDFLI